MKQLQTKVFGKSSLIGPAITFFAGVCVSLFSPAFNLATNDQWDTSKEGVPHLSVYIAFFYFCLLFCPCHHSEHHLPLQPNLPRSSLKAYLRDWNGRGWPFLDGFSCGFGNGLQFMGGQAAGYAAADAVQALPLVSTFWSILLFGEYRKSSRRAYILLVICCLCLLYLLEFLWHHQGIENNYAAERSLSGNFIKHRLSI